MNKTQCKYNNRNYITKPVAKRFADFTTCLIKNVYE